MCFKKTGWGPNTNGELLQVDKTIIKVSLPFLVIFEGTVLAGTAKIKKCLIMIMRSNTQLHTLTN